MLFVLIPIVWLAVLSLLVAVCRVAAEGDAALTSHSRAGTTPLGIRLTLSRASSTHITRTRRTHGPGSLARAAAPTRLRRAGIHAGRQH